MFENASALSLLLILLPVIILYLLKPKPGVIKIPSLMLLLSYSRKNKLKSLFDKAIRDPLLIIQLLAMTILIIGISGPYYFRDTGYDRTVIILDTSASMSASDIKPDRFSQAVEIAREYIEKSEMNSLILAQNVPVLQYRDKKSDQAIRELQGLKPKATGTDLNEAMMFALDLMGNETYKMVIISDFSGQDIINVQKIIESKKIPVEYRPMGIGGSNFGIIDAEIKDNSIKFIVKNYDEVSREITVKITNGDSIRSIKRTVKPNSREFFRVTNIFAGTTGISLETKDDFLIDNTLFISMPDSKSKRILLLSDSAGKNKPVYLAFKSFPDLEAEEVSFDRAPRKLDYGMVVLYDYTKSSLLPGTMDDIKNYVSNGGTAVFIAGGDLPLMDTKELLPVQVSGISKPSMIESIKSGLTNDIDFGISKYLKGTIKEGSVGLAFAKEGPILAYWNIGNGKVVYVGTNEEWGEFHLHTSYPIFWYKLLKFTSPASDELNFKSGTLLPLGVEKIIKGPQLTIRTDKLYLDETGFYEIENKTIASNLIDEKESDISVGKINFTEHQKISGQSMEKIHLDIILSFLAIIFVALELYYLKYRGDI
ncbi:MAG TPA: BatA and WFA domain-containing protein [Candidatus Methylomirabilis sp.]|nr:BatA and WFA domain-containing protein [Candidatus Methylomirabilis sp.]